MASTWAEAVTEGLAWTDENGTAHERCTLLFLSTQEAVPFDPGADVGFWLRAGIAYFCPFCGDVWDRIVMLDCLGQAAEFEVENVPCSKHWQEAYRSRASNDPEVPGSLLCRNFDRLSRFLPPQILRREFIVHHDHRKRKDVQNAILRTA